MFTGPHIDRWVSPCAASPFADRGFQVVCVLHHPSSGSSYRCVVGASHFPAALIYFLYAKCSKPARDSTSVRGGVRAETFFSGVTA